MKNAARKIIILFMTMMMVMSLCVVTRTEPVSAANGFSLESVGRPGKYLTVRNIDPAKAGGTLRTFKVAKRYGSANAQMYQQFRATYVVDETFVIYASDSFRNAYNAFHGTNYRYFALKECSNGIFRMVGTNDPMDVYNSQNGRFYWVKCQNSSGIYYVNPTTGHKLKVSNCGIWKAR